MQDHENRKHEGVFFECDICGKRAGRKGNIDDHKRRMHEGVKRFKCAVCEWSNFEKNALIIHIREHHKELNDKAKVEGSIVKIDWRSLKLNTNENNKISDPLALTKDSLWDCKICKRQMILRSRESHLKTYHKMTLTEYQDIQSLNSIAEEQFKCQHCTFEASELVLLDHMRLNHDVKNASFNCTVCSYISFSKNRLSYHMVEEHKDVLEKDVGVGYSIGPFKCHECSFTSHSEHEMVQHWRQLHDNRKQLNGKNEKTAMANSQVLNKDDVAVKIEEQEGNGDNQDISDTSLDIETNAEITEFLNPSD